MPNEIPPRTKPTALAGSALVTLSASTSIERVAITTPKELSELLESIGNSY